MELPGWFTPPPPSNWFAPPPVEPKRTRARRGERGLPTHEEGKALAFAQFEMFLPRILEQVCAGATVDKAIKSLSPIAIIDVGAFLRWLKKQPELYSMYREALEIRSEVWTGRMIQRAEGLNSEDEETANDVTRDKLAVDTYWKLIQAQNRKEYGDVKQLQIDQQISIVGALDAARARTRTIDVSAEVVDVDLLNDYEIRQLPAPADEEDDDE
jgi:hypothetical protein